MASKSTQVQSTPNANGLSPQAMSALVKKVEKVTGEGSLILGRDLKSREVPRITSGSLGLDLALGGGWPLNQWNEIIGHESHGKTALVLKTIAANMTKDPNWTVLWVASEQFVPVWAESLGVDLDRLYLLETNIMEDAFQVMNDWLALRAVDCVVLDSYPALIPKEEDEKAVGEANMGGAKIMNRFMRKSGVAIKRSLTEPDRPVLGFIINQWREMIGVTHGDPRTTPGGKGKNFSYFTRVEVSRSDWIKQQEERVGITIKCRTVKNKTYQPQQVAGFDFYFTDTPDGAFAKGDIDWVKEIVNIAITFDIIEQKGSWFYFGGQQWQGAAAVSEQMRYDLDLRDAVDAEVRKYVLHGED